MQQNAECDNYWKNAPSRSCQKNSILLLEKANNACLLIGNDVTVGCYAHSRMNIISEMQPEYRRHMDYGLSLHLFCARCTMFASKCHLNRSTTEFVSIMRSLAWYLANFPNTNWVIPRTCSFDLECFMCVEYKKNMESWLYVLWIEQFQSSMVHKNYVSRPPLIGKRPIEHPSE